MKRSLLYITSIIVAILIIGSCSSEGDSFFSDSGSDTGQGGSMARFTISGDYLYTVDQSTLKTFGLSTPDKPQYLDGKDQLLSFNIETIFAMGDTLLFIGSQDGMYIYSIKNAGFPQYISTTSHIRSCDPVIASGNYAYITLNSEGAWCGRGSNVLQIYDISDPYKPEQVLEMGGFTGPRGLGIDGKKLFICDNGLKVYDLTNPERPQYMDDLTEIQEVDNIDAYDVIPNNGVLLLVGKDGFFQFDYTGEKLRYLSEIPVIR